MTHSNPSESFPTSTEESLTLEDKPKVNHVYVEDPWVQEIGITLAYLFGLICVLSIEQPYCYASDEYLQEKMQLKERRVRDLLAQLESLGWVYRNTYNTPHGRKRHIIPKTKFTDYWDRFLVKPSVPEEVRKKFLEFAFKATGNLLPKATGNLTHRQNSAVAYGPAESCRSLLLRNNLDIQKRASADDDDDELELKKELEASGIQGESLKTALDYYHLNRDYVKERDNPIGFLIHMVRKGNAADKVAEASKREAQERIAESVMTARKARAQGLVKTYREKSEGIVLTVDEHSIALRIIGGPTYAPISWEDEKFDEKLKYIERLCDESVRDKG